jgi:hypothetical protein
MYICDICNRTYHWQCLLKTSCCNATEREAIDANDSWACPACINQNQNEKESRIHFQKKEVVEVSWNPTWKPEELQYTYESFEQSLNKFEEQITAPNLSQPAPDEHLNDLQKQGFSAIQEGNIYQLYNVDLRNKVSFDIQPIIRWIVVVSATQGNGVFSAKNCASPSSRTCGIIMCTLLPLIPRWLQ